MSPLLLKIKILILIVFLTGCQKEDNIQEDSISHEYHIPQIKGQISYGDFKNKLLKYNRLEEFENNFSDYTKNGNEDYIVYINTDEIITFTTDSLTTYTLSAITSDQDHLSFTNVIYVEKGNELYHGFLKYHPTEEWISSLLSGDKLPFEGLVSLIDSEGNILASENINGDYIPKAVLRCFISSEPIWQACYGQSCPCPDGNGYLIGWNFTISCTEGGSGGGGYPGGGNPGQGDLPTDPLEWALFMQLHALLGQGNFYFDNTINPNDVPQFSSFEEFEDFYNSPTIIESEVELLQDGTHTTKFRMQFGIQPYPATLHININQTLKSGNQQYMIHSINTNVSGLTIANFISDGYNISIDNIENIATIHLYGYINFPVGIAGFQLNLTIPQHYEIKIRTTTGFPLDFIEH